MKLWQRILLVGLVFALALSAPMPAYALNVEDSPPQQQGWLQWLLQWLGFTAPEPAPTPTPVSSPTPAVTEFQVSSLEQLAGLPALLTPGGRARVSITSADIEFMLTTFMASPSSGLQNGKITLLDGAVKVEGAVPRSVIEEQGIPLFFVGDLIQVEGEGSLAAVDCRLSISLKTAKVNGVSLPLVSLLDQMVNEALGMEWPVGICIESVTVTPQQVVVEGYRR